MHELHDYLLTTRVCRVPDLAKQRVVTCNASQLLLKIRLLLYSNEAGDKRRSSHVHELQYTWGELGQSLLKYSDSLKVSGHGICSSCGCIVGCPRPSHEMREVNSAARWVSDLEECDGWMPR